MSKTLSRLIIDHEVGAHLHSKQNTGHSLEVSIESDNLICITVRNREKGGTFARENMVFRRQAGSQDWELGGTKEFEGLMCPLKRDTVQNALIEKGIVKTRLAMLGNDEIVAYRTLGKSGSEKIDALKRALNARDGDFFGTTSTKNDYSRDAYVYFIEKDAARIVLINRAPKENATDRSVFVSTFEFRKDSKGEGWLAAVPDRHTRNMTTKQIETTVDRLLAPTAPLQRTTEQEAPQKFALGHFLRGRWEE